MWLHGFRRRSSRYETPKPGHLYYTAIAGQMFEIQSVGTKVTIETQSGRQHSVPLDVFETALWTGVVRHRTDRCTHC